MQRISTEPDGVFKNGVPGVQRGTKFNAEWCNAVQEELANFIETAGLELDADDSEQLRKALAAVFAAGLSLGDSMVHGSGSGANSSATLNHDKLGVAATGDVAAELHAEFVKFIRGQKTAQIGTKIVSNNIIVTINEIVEFAKNLIVKNILTVEGNAAFNQSVEITGALNIGGTVRSEGGFSGGISGRAGESANFPLIRADQILARTANGEISLGSVLSGLFKGTITGFVDGSWIPGDNAYFKRAADTIYPIVEMDDLPDGAIAVFYNAPSSASYVISWRDMNYSQRVKTVNSGTPFVFMKKKNLSNENCGMLLAVGDAGGSP